MQQQNNSQMVILGRLGASHGIKGWLKLISYTEPLENILNYKSLLMASDEKAKDWEACEFTDSKLQAKHILLKLKNCDSPEEAKLYTGKFIAVSRSELPAIEGYYWADLEGLTVKTLQGEILGIVNHVMPTGANDILVVKGKESLLIPYIDSVIIKIDLDAGEICVDWDPDF